MKQPPTDWVRVRDSRTGHHLTVSRSKAARAHYRILGNSPAVDINGRPLPPKILQSTPPEAGEQSPEGPKS